MPKYFCGSWTWYVTEFNARDLFFGLVDGQEKELGYFLPHRTGNDHRTNGLPIERDLYWKPTPLDQIAPELFRDEEGGRCDEPCLPMRSL